MNRQNQGLFEVPFTSEAMFYTTHSYTNPEFYSHPEWEAEWELSEAFSLNEEEWETVGKLKVPRRSVSKRPGRVPSSRPPSCPPITSTKPSVLYGWSQYKRRVEELPPAQQAMLRKVGNEIRMSYQPGCQPVRMVQIYGHADVDVRPNPQREKQMSDERGSTVTNWLKNYVGNNIAGRITWDTQGFGATKLKVPPTTEANRRQNRRVEIRLYLTNQIAPVNPNLIQRVQSCLNKLMGTRLMVNGKMGSETSHAIRGFQHRRGLSVNGMINPQTIYALIRVCPFAQPVATEPALIRFNEQGQRLINFDCGNFLVFVPEKVILGSRKDITDLKVHIFFAAGGVLSSAIRNNDVWFHGLRGSSNQSDWITIAVPGKNRGAFMISDKEIADCLSGIGITSPISSLRLTGHSRGTDSLVTSLLQKKITILSKIDRIVFLDEAVEHDGSGAIRLNRVVTLIRFGILAKKIVAYEVGNKSFDKVIKKSVRDPRAKYIDLDRNCMAAIGAVRLIKDSMELQPAIANLVNTNPKIKPQIDSLLQKKDRKPLLPPRGSFTTDLIDDNSIQKFCIDNSSAIQKIIVSFNDPETSLLNFIHKHDLSRYDEFDVRGRVIGKFRWEGFADHHFFVAEIAHELTN